MEFDSKGINHTEGGWPKDISHLDVEQVVRYRKKFEKYISYVNVISALGTVSVLTRRLLLDAAKTLLIN